MEQGWHDSNQHEQQLHEQQQQHEQTQQQHEQQQHEQQQFLQPEQQEDQYYKQEQQQHGQQQQQQQQYQQPEQQEEHHEQQQQQQPSNETHLEDTISPASRRARAHPHGHGALVIQSDQPGEVDRLSKENFNLKMQIFYQSERIESQGGETDETLQRDNIDMKMLLDLKQHEINERDETLQQARASIEDLQTDLAICSAELADVRTQSQHVENDIETAVLERSDAKARAHLDMIRSLESREQQLIEHLNKSKSEHEAMRSVLDTRVKQVSELDVALRERNSDVRMALQEVEELKDTIGNLTQDLNAAHGLSQELDALQVDNRALKRNVLASKQQIIEMTKHLGDQRALRERAERQIHSETEIFETKSTELYNKIRQLESQRDDNVRMCEAAQRARDRLSDELETVQRDMDGAKKRMVETVQQEQLAREDLQKKLTAVEHERDMLKRDAKRTINSITDELDTTRSKLRNGELSEGSIKREFQMLQRECDGVKRERDAATRALDMATRERDSATRERDTILSSQRDVQNSTDNINTLLEETQGLLSKEKRISMKLETQLKELHIQLRGLEDTATVSMGSSASELKRAQEAKTNAERLLMDEQSLVGRLKNKIRNLEVELQEHIERHNERERDLEEQLMRKSEANLLSKSYFGVSSASTAAHNDLNAGSMNRGGGVSQIEKLLTASSSSSTSSNKPSYSSVGEQSNHVLLNIMPLSSSAMSIDMLRESNRDAKGNRTIGVDYSGADGSRHIDRSSSSAAVGSKSLGYSRFSSNPVGEVNESLGHSQYSSNPVSEVNQSLGRSRFRSAVGNRSVGTHDNYSLRNMAASGFLSQREENNEQYHSVTEPLDNSWRRLDVALSLLLDSVAPDENVSNQNDPRNMQVTNVRDVLASFGRGVQATQAKLQAQLHHTDGLVRNLQTSLERAEGRLVVLTRRLTSAETEAQSRADAKARAKAHARMGRHMSEIEEQRQRTQDEIERYEKVATVSVNRMQDAETRVRELTKQLRMRGEEVNEFERLLNDHQDASDRAHESNVQLEHQVRTRERELESALSTVRELQLSNERNRHALVKANGSNQARKVGELVSSAMGGFGSGGSESMNGAGSVHEHELILKEVLKGTERVRRLLPVVEEMLERSEKAVKANRYIIHQEQSSGRGSVQDWDRSNRGSQSQLISLTTQLLRVNHDLTRKVLSLGRDLSKVYSRFKVLEECAVYRQPPPSVTRASMSSPMSPSRQSVDHFLRTREGEADKDQFDHSQGRGIGLGRRSIDHARSNGDGTTHNGTMERGDWVSSLSWGGGADSTSAQKYSPSATRATGAWDDLGTGDLSLSQHERSFIFNGDVEKDGKDSRRGRKGDGARVGNGRSCDSERNEYISHSGIGHAGKEYNNNELSRTRERKEHDSSVLLLGVSALGSALKEASRDLGSSGGTINSSLSR